MSRPESIAEIDAEFDAKEKKLTDWVKEPKLADLKAELATAKQATEKHVARVQDWVDAFDAKGNYAPPKVQGRSKMVSRLVRKNIEWRCPTLTQPFISNPKLFEIMPRTFEDEESAKQHELILNYQVKNRMNLVKFMDDLVRTMAVEGTSIVKTFWQNRVDKYKEPKYDYVPEQMIDPNEIEQFKGIIEEYTQSNPNILNTLDEGMKMSVNTFIQTGQMFKFTVQEVGEQEVTKILDNQPNAELCDIDDIYVDVTCKGDLKKAKFLVHRFDTSYSDLIADGRYINLDVLKSDIERGITNANTKPLNSDETSQFKDTARKKIEVHEYWGYFDTDDNGSVYSIVVSWVGNTIIRMERNPYPDNRIPFVFIPMIPIKNSIYGEPDTELLKDHQRAVSAIQRGLIDVMAKSANGQVGFNKGFLDSTNRKRFEQGQNYQYNGSNPEQNIHVHKFQELPNTVINFMQMINREAESLTGVVAFNNGITGDAIGSTKAAARSAMDATAIRDSSILDRIKQGIIEIAYKWQTMNSIFLDENDVIRITNATQSKLQRVDPNNLSGDFDLNIDISTPESDQAQVNDLVMLLQTGQQSFPFEVTQRILAKIAKLKKQPDIQEFFETYQPQPDPIAQKKQELELAKLEAEIAKLKADTAESMAKARVHEAEVNVRDARSENIQSNTDSKNINTYKDANGITQAERLEQEHARHTSAIAKAEMDNQHQIEMAKLNHNSAIQQKGAEHDLNSYGIKPNENSEGN